MLPLPIDPVLPEVVAALGRAKRVVLAAPPGAGKTTRVPRAMLDAGMAAEGEIVVLEPRRLAARMAARRVAEELGEPLGERVGYQVRFEEIASSRTRIRFVTEGVLTRKLVADATLPGVAAVVLDEFHERHLQGDVALALLARSALPLVVMSATLAAEPIAAFLDAPVVRSEGKLFEVAIEHLPAPDDRPLESQVASAVRRLAREGLAGHVLVFLPGAAEIRRATEACEAVTRDHDLELHALHGDLPAEEQDRVVRGGARRKVILSTNVAESSITIEGVVAVVDSGLARVASHAPWSGLPRLRVEKVSRASATQRAGRAGRTEPGRCLRLYTKGDFDQRPEYETPEIRRADLAQTVLELRASGAPDPRWFEPPPEAAVRAAEALLARLGALDENGQATRAGATMARFALHPRQSRLVLEAAARGVGDDGCTIAALLGERDVRAGARAQFGDAARARGHAGATERSDLLARLEAFEEAEAARFSAGALRAAGLDGGAVRAADRARKQIARALRGCRDLPARGGEDDAETALLKAVLAAYPDRVAKRVRPQGRALALGGGGSAELAEASAVRDAEWMAAVDAEEASARAGAGGTRAGIVVRLASGIQPDWLLELFPGSIREEIEVRWSAAAERALAVERMTYDGLVLDEAPSNAPSARASALLAEAALALGPHAFAPEGALARWLARARFAAGVRPDLPAPSDADVRAALTRLCEGRTSFAELREAGLLDALRAGQAARAGDLERLAPDRVGLAGGRTVPVHYEDGKPPWIESYLQDFFGMSATPMVGNGQVPLVVHLWAPNKRAVQVTRDLAGFWSRSYPAIRKELMRKYPRHSWPEDPTTPAPRMRPRH